MATINTILGTHTLKDSRSIINANFSAINDQIEDIIELEGIPGPEGPEGPEGPMGTGIIWRGAWSNATSYDQYDAVSYDGSSWIAEMANSATTPGTDPTKWSVFAQKGSSSSTSNLLGQLSGLPPANTVNTGTSYQCTDAPLKFLHDGTVWKPTGLINIFSPPVLSNFTDQSSTANITDTGSGLLIHGSVNTVSLYRSNSNVSAPFSVTGYYSAVVGNENYGTVGITAWDKTGGANDNRYVLWGVQSVSGTLNFVVQNFNSNGTWAGNALQVSLAAWGFYPNIGMWMRIYDDNTNRLYQLSSDGTQWTTALSVSRTNHCTVNRGGWSAAGSSSHAPNMRIYHLTIA